MCGRVSAGVWTWMRNGGAYATLDERSVRQICHDAVMAYDEVLAQRIRERLGAERDGVAPLVMNRRPMRGWLRVAPDVVADDASLDEWVTRRINNVKGTVKAPGDGTV